LSFYEKIKRLFRLKRNTEKGIPLKADTTKVPTGPIESIIVAEHRRKDKLLALEEKVSIQVKALEMRISENIALQFSQIKGSLERLEASCHTHWRVKDVGKREFKPPREPKEFTYKDRQ